MKRIGDMAFAAGSWLAAAVVITAAALLVGYLASKGGATLGANLLFGDTPWQDAVAGTAPVLNGLWPAVVGTVLLVVGACAFAFPLGILSGICLAEYATGRARRILVFLIDLLAGVPSIIMGLFGFGLILLLRSTFLPNANTCVLLSMVCIGMLVLPYVIRTTETALRALPAEVRLAGPGLGLSRWQSIRFILLPSASRGILGGIVIAIGRAAQDTAVIMLTGAVATTGLPAGLLDKFEAVPYMIFYTAAQHRDAAELDMAFGAALVLLCVTALLFATAGALHRGLERQWGKAI